MEQSKPPRNDIATGIARIAEEIGQMFGLVTQSSTMTQHGSLTPTLKRWVQTSRIRKTTVEWNDINIMDKRTTVCVIHKPNVRQWDIYFGGSIDSGYPGKFAFSVGTKPSNVDLSIWAYKHIVGEW